jgi:hypothetical protein
MGNHVQHCATKALREGSPEKAREMCDELLELIYKHLRRSTSRSAAVARTAREDALRPPRDLISERHSRRSRSLCRAVFYQKPQGGAVACRNHRIARIESVFEA